MSNDNNDSKEYSKNELEEIQSMLNSPKQKFRQQAKSKADEQLQRALKQLELQAIDLVAQILGFMPTAEQRKKYGDVKRNPEGRLVFYWENQMFLRLDPIKLKPEMKRGKLRVRPVQNYEIIKDDPTGYKAKNPLDNYVVNHYDEAKNGGLIT